jgi:hypothetical protein
MAVTVTVRSPNAVTPTWKLLWIDHWVLLAMPSVPAGGLVVAVSYTTRFEIAAGADGVADLSAELALSPAVLVAETT